MVRPSVRSCHWSAVLAFVFFISSGASLAAESNGNWLSYQSKEDGFSVNVPSALSRQDSTSASATGPILSHVYALELGVDRAFTMNVTDLKHVPNSPESVLQAAMDGTAHALGAKPTEQGVYRMGGANAVHFVIITDAFELRARYVLRGAKLYALVFSMPRFGSDEALHLEEADRILDSFHFDR